jgi:hypothetical protein
MLLAFGQVAGCSSCEDQERTDPWNVEEIHADKQCSLSPPTDGFVKVEEHRWQRVFEPVREGCGDYQIAIVVAENSERWNLSIKSRICNRCDDKQSVRGQAAVSTNAADEPLENVAGAFAVVGVKDVNGREFAMGCQHQTGEVVALEKTIVTRQIDIDPGLMYPFEYGYFERDLHPPIASEDRINAIPYYDAPVNFERELDLVIWWPRLRATSTLEDDGPLWNLEEIMCFPEFDDDPAKRERGRELREQWYFRHVIEEPQFPLEFASFLRSRNFSE